MGMGLFSGKPSQGRRDAIAAEALRTNLGPALRLANIGEQDAVEIGPARHTAMRLGEVSRHFDTNTASTISGWLTHNLGFHGWAIGAEVGGVELGSGSLGLSGTSQVSLTTSGTSRDNLMSDGFFAVLEQDTPSGIDTLRMVVPSEQAARELVKALLDEALDSFTAITNPRFKTRWMMYPQAHSTLAQFVPMLLSFPDEASYVSDRLHAVIRMPEPSRPLLNIWGEPLGQHAVLASSVQFGDEGAIQPLFPVDLITQLQVTTRLATYLAEYGKPPV
jgi:hypothetical protein